MVQGTANLPGLRSSGRPLYSPAHGFDRGGIDQWQSSTGTHTEALRAKRDRYVARGVSIAPIFAARAHGARLTDADGREYIDFAGGIGVLNLGHTPEAVVEAISEQAEQLIHACFPVAAYEPYLEVCRMLCELAPGTHDKKAAADQLRRRGGRERRQDRPLPHGPPRRDHVRPRLPRPHAADDDAHLEARLQARAWARSRPRSTGRRRRIPTAASTTEDALEALDWMFKATVDPAVGGVRDPRAGAGRGRLHGDAARVHPGPEGALRGARHPLHRRRGAGRHGPHRHAVGHRALRRRPRPDHGRQVARLGHAAGRRDRARRGHGLGAPGRPRLDLRRQPGGLRRRRSRASRRSPTRLPGPRGRGRRAHPRRA